MTIPIAASYSLPAVTLRVTGPTTARVLALDDDPGLPSVLAVGGDYEVEGLPEGAGVYRCSVVIDASAGQMDLRYGVGPVERVEDVAETEASKCLCTECNLWHGLVSELLTAPDPFNDGEIIHACPDCRQVAHISIVCDEPGCWRQVSCGTSTPGGYRQTCGEHKP